MGGGLMQLVAYGAQDIYLTGNPQITFFKVVYRRHTNFSMESIQQTFSGGGNNVVATISRNGDLVHKMYLVGTEGSAGPPIKTVELEIGGQRIDRQSGKWMDTWNELSTSESKAIGLKAMTGQIGTVGAADGVHQQHIPLLFWFCRNPGLALPLIALQYHEVKVKFSLGDTNTYTLYCDYIYLDTDERRRFAQVSHEYLIEQVQEQTTAANGKNKLNFNHPVKELIWRSSAAAETVGLKLNGHDRFSTRNDEYFYLQQPFDYHTAVPRQNLPTAAQVFKTNLADHRFTVPTLGPSHTIANVACATTIYSLGAEKPDGHEVSETAGTTVGTVGVAHYLATDGVLTLTAGENSGTRFTDTLADSGFTVGGQIAIIPTNAGVAFDAADVVLASGAASSEGQVFFATITSAVSAHSVLSLTITPPTLSGGGQVLTKLVDFDGINKNTAEAAATQVAIFIVNSAVDASARTSKDTDKIGVYSFALKPEEHQPSGTCNFSRIDNAELTLTGATAGTIYAVNYNVLRIMSGMGGLAYSN